MSTAWPHQGTAIVSRDQLSHKGWKLEEVAVRQPGPGELLVEIVASGVCHTDILIGDLPDGASPVAFYPRVLGHEGSGIVKNVGIDVSIAQPGEAVLLSYAHCGRCALCKTRKAAHCLDFNAINFSCHDSTFRDLHAGVAGGFFGQSSFANLTIVKECSVVNVQNHVQSRAELELYAPLGCGIQTGSGTVLHVAKAEPSDVVCVVGLGSVGLSAIIAAKLVGCETIIGVDRVQSRLDMARQVGASAVVNTAELGNVNLVDTIRSLACDNGPNITIESTGAPPLIKDSLIFTRPAGKIIQIGAAPFDFLLEVNVFEWMVQGKQYMGAVEGHSIPTTYIPQMIEWHKQGKFPFEKFIKRMPFSAFNQAVEEMHSGATIKPILCWNPVP